MSRMLQALKNLSSRHSDQVEQPAISVNDGPLDDVPATAADDPVLPPADHRRSMQDLLVKHLSAAPASAMPPLAAEGAGGMTVPMASLRQPALETGSSAMSFLVSDEEEENVRESVEVVCLADPAEQRSGDAESVSIVSIGAVAKLLASLEEAEEKREEEVALSFASEAESVEVAGQVAEVREANEVERSLEVEQERVEVIVSEPEPNLEPSSCLPVSPSMEAGAKAELRTEAEAEPTRPEIEAASPLDHLADARPLVTYSPDEEETPATSPAFVLPPRSIHRNKTRLEQRVCDNLSHASRSLPYRELADRLQQDIRLLTGRCLLFAGIGPASHADDVLPHLASLLAEDDAEVLLVDADGIRAGLSVGFGALKETGLGELPEGTFRCEELVLPTLLSNVALLPAGRKPLPDTIGVVDQVAQLLAQLEQRYSLVLIDGGSHTGPLVPALARLCDATYFVVRLGATDARAAGTAVQTFRANGARILGCIATSAATSK